MKAKEYAVMYFEAENKYQVSEKIMVMFIMEIKTLIEARNAKYDRALIPICNELDNKWRKFASIVNANYPAAPVFKYTGFQNVVKSAMPELYELWTKK